jgi:outer membrane protein assembly factor BamD
MKCTDIILCGVILGLLICGCATAPPKGTLDAEDQYLLAKDLFDNDKYEDAQIEFQKLIWNFPGSDYVDEGQYYLAECLFQLEDFTGALIEYGRLLRSYSKSPFAGAAQYKVGLCYFEQSLPARLDQEATHNAIRELGIFLEEYPNSEYISGAQATLLAARTKLAQKDYLNGKLYHNMGQYEAAILYLEEVIRDYSDTKWAADAQYLIGECYRRQKNWPDALAAYANVLELNPSVKTASRAHKRITQIKEKPGESSE